MIITVSIVTGFQNKIREKVIGFGSHIQITGMQDNTSMESTPLLIDSALITDIGANQYVKHLQTFAFKPAILQSEENETIISIADAKDTVKNRDVLGVLFKGIDQSYDLTFFENKMIDGQIIDFESDMSSVMISSKIAALLQYEVGDDISAYFILNNTPKKRSFTIVGIYKTGLEEFDKKIIFTNIGSLQKLSNWGISTALTVEDTCINNQFVLKGLSFSNFEQTQFKWNGTNSKIPLYLIDSEANNKVEFEAAEFNKLKNENDVLWDKSTATFIIDSACACNEEILRQKPIEYLSASEINMPFGKIMIENGEGNSHNYIGGYEILINKWDDLDKMDSIIYQDIPFDLKTTKITDLYIEIFSWLNFLDMNIAVIILMMLIVSLINMVTSLLVLIIEKTNFIGILKAIGATNWSIRKIFIFNAFLLLIKGLIWGNIIGISLIALQYYFNIIPLNPEIYFLEAVPVSFDMWNILLINLLTIATCFLILIVPSYLITKIKPIKAIKFN